MFVIDLNCIFPFFINLLLNYMCSYFLTFIQGVILSAKKANSAAAKATRAWGRGVSCSGVEKRNTDVPIDYKGPIPGIQVGQTWQYRLQACI